MSDDKRFRPEVILASEDPVDLMSNLCWDAMLDDSGFMASCIQLVYRDMGLHPKSMVGGDQDDLIEFYTAYFEERGLEWNYLTQQRLRKQGELPDYLTEDDPKYDLYWANLSLLMNQVLAHMVSRERWRWTPEAIRKRNEHAKQHQNAEA